MALNIKDAETDRLVRELAGTTHETITDAVRTAVAQRLDRERARASADRSQADLAALIQRGRSRPTLDDRDQDQILGYDANGLPC
ncbi:MAG: type II toxin-antitoxin system VapB family antitoxin [Bifidobacteriaceae bacterium]|jgi:antitoxin VapB|nr:type II toxin-antitoxin system VapB family antitoxin [Bifidobacteriaceae bacterium]